MKKVIIALLALALIAGAYYFFFSDRAKKISLFKKIVEKHKSDAGFDASVDGLLKSYETKSYQETLASVNKDFPNDKY